MRRRLRQPEAAIQREIKAVLTMLGYTVMETGKGRSRVACSACGAKSYATGWQGNTPGLPDLYVHRKGWGNPVAIALELKAADGKPTETQQWLEAMGMTRIVRSAADALDVLMGIESAWGHREQVARIADTIKTNQWRTNEHPDS
jgi:hypothetical protein